MLQKKDTLYYHKNLAQEYFCIIIWLRVEVVYLIFFLSIFRPARHNSKALFLSKIIIHTIKGNTYKKSPTKHDNDNTANPTNP